MLNTVDGRTSLKKMFPSMTKEWDDIIYMQKNLGEWGSQKWEDIKDWFSCLFEFEGEGGEKIGL